MIVDKINESIIVKKQMADDPAFVKTVEKTIALLVDAFQNGHKVLFCGNGGSAADAQHLAAELSGRFYFDRPPLPAEACHVNSSFLTAVSNDYSFDQVFARYINAMGNRGDILIGLSTSGNSTNVVEAFKTAKERGMICIGFTGSKGGKMKDLSDVHICVPSDDTPRIQESHITIGHIICEMVEKTLFGNVQ
ncbi:D-sedoheptulose 7-phosphate isomerase [Mariniphaga sediminis]|jgi:D-sedoheptulose 7-phosphate isomerase|uniref:Phosphoheptose isomerase n=1 Tax=Mariniphaga sediminis TaxID=1628158 RepID=A0A399D2B1_9BACT|nr:D-sedoheptulose 7-phosphate isomerase [Mariniphaga sediminis]RIH66105.1 D-sedoheptulose 7-phosphate isomerase [Mariniphaga sediminis]